jgi:hypothetical protein
MDPIHPIIPQQPTIGPVTPAPTAARIDREHRRDADAGGGRKRRARPDATVSLHGTADDPADQASWEEYDVSDFDEDGEGGLHVDVSA